MDKATWLLVNVPCFLCLLFAGVSAVIGASEWWLFLGVAMWTYQPMFAFVPDEPKEQPELTAEEEAHRWN